MKVKGAAQCGPFFLRAMDGPNAEFAGAKSGEAMDGPNAGSGRLAKQETGGRLRSLGVRWP
jgi:hypothetical protein